MNLATEYTTHIFPFVARIVLEPLRDHFYLEGIIKTLKPVVFTRVLDFLRIVCT